jgi:hypothetical protein
MVKRICVLFPDGSMNVISGSQHRTEQINEARRDAAVWNKNERDPRKLAQFGEIDVDLIGFKELC